MRPLLARLVLILLAISLLFANVATAAMPLGGSPTPAQHAHCHAVTSAAKHACGDPHSPCCAIACDCAPCADLGAVPAVVGATPAIADHFPTPRARIVASVGTQPLRPPIA